MDLHEMPPHSLCYELDRICPDYWFTFDGIDEIRTIFVSRAENHSEKLTSFVVDKNNPLEYVLTKILLQFSGGTVNA